MVNGHPISGGPTILKRRVPVCALWHFVLSVANIGRIGLLLRGGVGACSPSPPNSV